MPYRTHSFMTEGKPPFLRALKPSQIAGTRAAATRICWLAEDRCYCNACHPVSGDPYRLPWSCSAISDSIIPVNRRCALFRISALRDRIPARLLQLLRNTCRRRMFLFQCGGIPGLLQLSPGRSGPGHSKADGFSRAARIRCRKVWWP